MSQLQCWLMLVGIATGVFSTPEDGFCSNVYQMHRHCVNQGNTVLDIRQGKAGPRGEKGSPAAVDYDVIDRKLDQKLSEFKATVNAKLTQCQRAVRDNQEKIEELEQKLTSWTVTDCRRVAPEDAKSNNESGGVFDIYVEGDKTEVYCDLTTDGGGWTVFQRRLDGSVNFFRGWSDYVNGFGHKNGEFWLGLETLHRLTASKEHEMRVELEDWEGNKRFAKYSTFKIGDASSNYRLTIGGYSGDATDSVSRENGRAFSTKGADHDTYSGDCADLYKGAWWYGSCHQANLNGLYHKGGAHSSYADGVNWRHWKGYNYSLKFVEMKIRPLN